MSPGTTPTSMNAPPFTADSAARKVRAAEDAWNTRDPVRVALAYTEDSVWRNRDVYVHGRDQIRAFLAGKWEREHEYRLAKASGRSPTTESPSASDTSGTTAQGNWFRSYGNELWEFDAAGLMRRREASINDLAIREDERRFHWPLGRRPDDHPGLDEEVIYDPDQGRLDAKHLGLPGDHRVEGGIMTTNCHRTGVASVEVGRVTGSLSSPASDELSVEEPLEIRLSADGAGGARLRSR